MPTMMPTYTPIITPSITDLRQTSTKNKLYGKWLSPYIFIVIDQCINPVPDTGPPLNCDKCIIIQKGQSLSTDPNNTTVDKYWWQKSLERQVAVV